LIRPEEGIIDVLLYQLRFFGEPTTEQIENLIFFLEKAKKSTQDILDFSIGIPKIFNVLQTHHCTIFLYQLARLLYVNDKQSDLCEKLYLLNRMLNGVDLYYKIQMPKYFLVGHGLGTVFSRAQYGNYLVVFQNVTIAVQDKMYPMIGEKVVIYPNSIVAGNTVIGNNSVIGAGTVIINKSIPDNSIVFLQNGLLTIKNNDRHEIQKYFDISALDN
jgi:serine O-acetyltransferase